MRRAGAGCLHSLPRADTWEDDERWCRWHAASPVVRSRGFAGAATLGSLGYRTYDSVGRLHDEEHVGLLPWPRAPGRLDAGTVPIELIELVAHETRWPELQELAQQRIDKFFGGDATLAVGDVAHRLSEAYDDNWQDRDFYQHYNR
jgi:hypothetical protein